MNSFFPKIFMALLLLSCCTQELLGRANDPPTCNAELPVVLPPRSDGIDMSAARFRSDFGESKIDFWVTNLGALPITSLVAVVELREAGGGYLFDMVVRAFNPRENHSLPLPSFLDLRSQTSIQFDGALVPHEKRYWGVSSSFVSTACPTQARVTFLAIQYSGAPDVVASMSTVRMTSSIIDASYLDPQGMPAVLPAEILVKVHVDKEGRPLVVEGDGAQEVTDWIRGALSHWEFVPATVDSVPVEDELRLLFRFREGSVLPSQPGKQYDGVLQIVDVFPPEPGKHILPVHLGKTVVSRRGIPDY